MKKIYIIAGESSGDFIGAKLMQQLKQQDNLVDFCGIGGSLMESQGLKSLFSMEKLSVMGFIEVIKKIFMFKKLIKQTALSILEYNPNILITIDSLGFNKRVAKLVKAKNPNIILLHYVAPSVWAWKPKRAIELSHIYNYLFCLFDFELPYFNFDSLKTYCVGHPIVESGANLGNPDDLINKYNLNPTNTYILLMPGSRITEVSRLLPIFSQAISNIQLKYPNVQAILPTLPHLYSYIQSYLQKNNLNYILLNNIQDKYNSFKLAKMGLIASGTASLELSIAQLHTLVAYRVNPISAYIASKLIKIKFASIINIVLNKEVITEYIQQKCNVANITNYIDNFLQNKYNEANKTEIYNILHNLGYENFIPSQKASNIILNILNNKE